MTQIVLSPNISCSLITSVSFVVLLEVAREHSTLTRNQGRREDTVENRTSVVSSKTITNLKAWSRIPFRLLVNVNLLLPSLKYAIFFVGHTSPCQPQWLTKWCHKTTLWTSFLQIQNLYYLSNIDIVYQNMLSHISSQQLSQETNVLNILILLLKFLHSLLPYQRQP